MKDPLGVSPSKGNQGTTRGKEKNSFDLGGNRTHDPCINNNLHLARKYVQILVLGHIKYLHTCLFKFINTTKYINLKRESRG